MAQCSPRDHWLNWSRLRGIGSFPLFGVSWTTFGFSLLYINTIGFLNRTKFVQAFSYPLPIPDRVSLLLIPALLIVLGSTMHKIACPSRTQDFSETQWVEEHKNPRLGYIADSLSRGWRRWMQWPTAAFTILGGVLAGYLVFESLFYAISTLLPQVSLVVMHL